MNSYQLYQFTSSLGSLSSFLVGIAMMPFVLAIGIRWFIFKKAGIQGWKALIPFYSDYLNYKLVWDGRIYTALLAGGIAAVIVTALFGLINYTLGSIIGTLLGIAYFGFVAIAGIILQFKMARAFGRSDYFAVGLYFLGPVFSAILAFGDAQYKGPVQDGMGVPKFVSDLEQKAAAAAANVASAAAQQMQQRQQQQQQQAYAPQQPQQGYPTNYPQNYQPQAGYPQDYQQPAPRAGRRTQRNSGQYDQFDQ